MPASKSKFENLHSGQVFLSHTNVVKCDDGLIVSNLILNMFIFIFRIYNF